MPMTVQSMHSVGLLVPPSNPTLEIEIKQLLDDQVYLYVSRFPSFLIVILRNATGVTFRNIWMLHFALANFHCRPSLLG